MLIQDAIKHIKKKEVVCFFVNGALVFKGDIDKETDSILEDFREELYTVAAVKDILQRKDPREVPDKTSEGEGRTGSEAVRGGATRTTGQDGAVTGRPNRLPGT